MALFRHLTLGNFTPSYQNESTQQVMELKLHHTCKTLVPSDVLPDLLTSYEATAQRMVAQGRDMQTIARLLCLASITVGDIKTRTLESVKRGFPQVRT
ncbi:hypothetical protein EDC04DRAFT_2621154 [Pisolithus marmoratus]|nr:hypothetical protein EDC04DRAFT_2621154 [Pisolithus marmoratus]